jgi:membrane protein implicated in regulation of membrane protease activity
MTALFALTILMGTAAGVCFVARGVERRVRGREHLGIDEFGRETGPGHIALGVPVVAAVLIGFGIVGYAALRLGATGLLLAIGSGLIGALLAGVLAARIVARWAEYAAEHDVHDVRFVLQGHVATVIQAGEDDAPAEVEYNANGRRVVVPARSVDDSPLAKGTEVVIERLEGGIVYVEAWTHVEERL